MYLSESWITNVFFEQSLTPEQIKKQKEEEEDDSIKNARELEDEHRQNQRERDLTKYQKQQQEEREEKARLQRVAQEKQRQEELRRRNNPAEAAQNALNVAGQVQNTIGVVSGTAALAATTGKYAYKGAKYAYKNKIFNIPMIPALAGAAALIGLGVHAVMAYKRSAFHLNNLYKKRTRLMAAKKNTSSLDRQIVSKADAIIGNLNKKLMTAKSKNDNKTASKISSLITRLQSRRDAVLRSISNNQ